MTLFFLVLTTHHTRLRKAFENKVENSLLTLLTRWLLGCGPIFCSTVRSWLRPRLPCQAAPLLQKDFLGFQSRPPLPYGSELDFCICPLLGLPNSSLQAKPPMAILVPIAGWDWHPSSQQGRMPFPIRTRQ